MTAPRIAIVGIACRYPDAADPEQLWQNVLAGRRAFRRIPEVRLGSGYRGGPDDPDRTYLSHAAVLRDWEFDRPAFGVPGPLHRAVDHTHWLALETAAGALADAGCPGGDGLDRDNVGVILGNSLTGEFSRAGLLRLRWPFIADAATEALHASGVGPDAVAEVVARMEELVKSPFPVPGDETLAGALANTIAGRICNTFDFHGTGFTVDGACSSSLLAVSMACTALADGDCDAVVTGGVDMSMDPFELVGFARLGALASSEMRVYDRDPTGFLPGEGCGMLVLMRAADARARGMRAYADIVGWATSSDGAGGITRPTEAGQILALRRAYRRAELRPGEAELVEGHGTGTAIGDEVELAALTAVRTGADRPAALGSIKANIGHTKAAAGAAGLLKVTQAVHRRMLPRTTGCVRPHPLLEVPGVPLRLLDTAEEWTSDRPTAGVSSMGFGGINAHVVVQASVDPPRRRRRAESDRPWSGRVGPHEIVTLGADGPAELGAALTALAEAAGALSVAELRDVAVTTSTETSGAGVFRSALVARTPEELGVAARGAAAATAGWDGHPRLDVRAGWALGSARPVRVGLLLPGQAAPVHTAPAWWATRLDTAVLTRRPLPAPGADPDTATAQPWIVAQTLLGLDWLGAIGCEPVLSVGHSLGEISALCWAGSLTKDDAVALAIARGRLMAHHGSPGTGMAALAATPVATTRLLEGTAVTLSGYNAPDRTVVSGRLAELDLVLARARRSDIAGVLLSVSHGFHSEAMARVAEPLRAVLADLDLRAPRRSVISTVSGAEIGPGTTPAEIRKLLVAQLTEPVLFSDAVRALAERVELIVEAGPGTVLTGLARQNAVGVPTVAVDAGGDPRWHAVATAALAACAGADIRAWFSDRPYRRLAAAAVPQFVPSACAQSPAGVPVQPAVGRASADRSPVRPVDGPADPLAVVTDYLARTLELPVESIGPSQSLLADLHLSSLQVVQTVVSAAAVLGVTAPAAPPSVGSLTVADLVTVLREQPAADPTPGGPTTPGVAPWTRLFSDRWEIVTAGEPATDITWTVAAPDGHPWRRLAGFGAGPRRGLAVALAADAGVADIAGLLSRVHTDGPDRLLLGHTGHPAGPGIARALHAELERCDVVVVDLPPSDSAPDAVAVAAIADPGPTGFRELRIGPDATIRTRTLGPLPLSAGPLPLGPGDVCLVTGGPAGITARCARELAERTGAVLVFLGRTPADDPRLTQALARHAAHYYVCCDVTDPAQVTTAIIAARAYGPVRGLLHGAAVNEPRRLADVSVESLGAVLAPKVDGLTNLLRAADDLTLVVGFGSIIGRQGLAGQAEYCIANAWLRDVVERWAAARPLATAHVVEWSAWAGVGMAERLGVLDSLRTLGVTPIRPEDGAALLLDLLSDPAAPVAVLATSRFVSTPTLGLPAGDAPWLRFGERRPVFFPGVEAVLEADLSLGTDPALDEHRIDGIAVLPAVMGVEAMAQAAALLRGTGRQNGAWSARDLRFTAPVMVDDGGCTVLRTAALAAANGSVDVVLRAGTDGFATDRVRGCVTDVPAQPQDVPDEGASPTSSAATGHHPYYDCVLFHRGRFRRLIDYAYLSAFRVTAWIGSGTETGWFSPFHDQALLLGDPGAFDAAMHVLLPCVPHRLALPVGADRFTVWRRPAGLLRVEAVERWHGDGEYRFDVDVRQRDGAAVAAWNGLALRATGPVAVRSCWPIALVGPWLSRRLIESGLAGAVELSTPEVAGTVLRCVADGAADLPVRVSAARAALTEPTRELTAGRGTEDGLLELCCGSRRVVTARTTTDRGPVVAAIEVDPR